MDAVIQDLRYAVRHLRKSPWFAGAAVLTLALAIGANSAMFAMLHALVLEPLAVKDPHNLIAVTGRNQQDQLQLTLISIIPELERDGPLDAPCGINGNGVFAADVAGVPTQSVIAIVTGRCFETFGVSPLLGRVLTPDDMPAGGPGNPVTVIGHRFWTRMFGQDPKAIGQTLRMEGVELTIVGVMPPEFNGIQADFGIDVWLPNYTVTPRRPDRAAGAAQILGRLKPGTTLEAAQAELTTRWPALMAATVPASLPALERASFASPRVRIERISTGVSYFRDRFAQPVTMVMALTGVLLLLACINLGGLLLSRLAARSSEIGIRLALGGGRWRIAQQLLIESLLLSVSGAVTAVPLSFAFVGLLQSFLPPGAVDAAVSLAPDATVLAATAAAGVLAGLLMSTVPIWLAARRGGGMTLTWDRTVAGHTGRWTRTLLVSQIALSVVMLAGAGLLTRSLYALQHAPLGIRTDGVLNVRIMPVPDGYRGMDASSYYRAMAERVVALPGVRSIGFARSFPRSVSDFMGRPIARLGDDSSETRAQLESASPGFFETVGIPLLRGRYPSWSDTAQTPQVAIVSESLARQLQSDGEVIGMRVRFGTNRSDQDVQIVGVVGNASLGNPRQASLPIFYRPMLQAGPFAYYPSLVIAAAGDPMTLAPAVRRIVGEGGREYANHIEPVAATFLRAPSAERMTATVSAAVAGIAIVLAFIGVYSLLAYSVAQRTREIGVRVALGAARSRVLAMVMREGLLLTASGVAIGIPLALTGGRVLRTLLYGVGGADPAVLVACAVFFITLGIAAGLAPARRAASVDPVVALRNE
jgi:predicted permease